jgi:hypothetical protein
MNRETETLLHEEIENLDKIISKFEAKLEVSTRESVAIMDGIKENIAHYKKLRDSYRLSLKED